MQKKINKRDVFNKLLSTLVENLEVIKKASDSAFEAATHEESKAEDQYDTRGLEASYLAGAQSQRLSSLEKTLYDLQNFPVRDFSASEKIDLGALVHVNTDGLKNFLFLLPYGGGTFISVEGKAIAVISPASPIGSELLGKSVGDVFEVKTKGHSKEVEILEIF